MRMDLTFYNFDLDIFYLHNVECVYVDYCFHWQPILRIDFMIKAFYSSICKHTKEMTTLSTVTFLFFIYNKSFYSNKTHAVMSVKVFYLFLYFKLHNIINLSLSLLACEVHPGMLIYWMGRKASPTLKFINNQSFMDSVEKWLDCIWLMIDGWMDGWMDGWTDGQMDRQKDGWMDVKHGFKHHQRLPLFHWARTFTLIAFKCWLICIAWFT